MPSVVVCGALGRMGLTIGRMVNESADLDLVGGIDIKPGSFFGVDVVESSQLGKLLEEKCPDILIDFTVADAAVQNAKAGAKGRNSPCNRYDRVYPRPAG